MLRNRCYVLIRTTSEGRSIYLFVYLFISSPVHSFPTYCAKMTDSPLSYIVMEVVIALASVVGNVMVVWAVKINRALRDTTFYFVVSLALADIAVGALVIPLAITISTGLETYFYSCLMVACIMLVLTQSSILALLAIAIDRYLRVKIPLR